MEINFNNGKNIERQHLEHVAEIVDENNKNTTISIEGLIHINNIRGQQIRVIETRLNDIENAYSDAYIKLVELIGEILPQKYRPQFTTKSRKIIKETKNELNARKDACTGNFLKKCEELQKEFDKQVEGIARRFGD